MEKREKFKNKMAQFAKRPGMYVGGNRFDYIQCFYNGWSYADADMFRWYCDYDMQKWLFMQVRFLYYSQTHGWIENTSLQDGKQYYYDLVILHAYCALVQKEEHKNHIIMLDIRPGNIEAEVREADDIWYRIFNKNEDLSSCNLNPFQRSYAAWKNSVLETTE